MEKKMTTYLADPLNMGGPVENLLSRTVDPRFLVQRLGFRDFLLDSLPLLLLPFPRGLGFSNRLTLVCGHAVVVLRISVVTIFRSDGLHQLAGDTNKVDGRVLRPQSVRIVKKFPPTNASTTESGTIEPGPDRLIHLEEGAEGQRELVTCGKELEHEREPTNLQESKTNQ